MRTIIYVREDGSTFEAPIFHHHMEHAGVVDPRDGVLKAFETVWDIVDGDIVPVKRVEVPQ